MKERSEQRPEDIWTRLREIAIRLGATEEQTDLDNWREDLDSPFKIVVLGEFNRGKSSVLNALFGMRSLPVGILPTTSVVTVLRYADQPHAHVHNRDGSIEQLPWSNEAIARYVGTNADLTLIDFVEVGYPHPLLKAGAMFVDTPGVSDLNQQRVEVTYRYIPRADAVLFVLDSTTPVTQSEMNFLQSTVLEVDGTELLFLANSIDLLDEDERNDAVRTVSRRIREGVGRDCTIVAISAKEAQQAGNCDRSSGFADLNTHLVEMIQRSHSSQERLTRFKARLETIAIRLLGIAEERVRLFGLREDQLQSEMDQISDDLNRRIQKLKTLTIWLRDREEEVVAMTAKSLDRLGKDLQEDVLDQLTHYSGSDLRQLVTTQVPLTAKRRMKGWIDSHSPALQRLLEKFSREITGALAREFRTTVAPLTSRSLQVDPEAGALSVSMPREFWTPRSIAGLIGGGAAIALGLATGGLLIPVVSMVATPMIAEHLSQDRVEKQKREQLPSIREALSTSHDVFRSSVLQMLRDHFLSLGQAAEERFRSLAEESLRMVREELDTRRDQQQVSRLNSSSEKDLVDELKLMASRIHMKEEVEIA